MVGTYFVWDIDENRWKTTEYIINTDYINEWFANFRVGKNGYVVMTATELHESVKLYHKQPFLTHTKIGKDLKTIPYIKHKRTSKRVMYSINCGHSI
jgi:hypothetical protein